ncbi:hypothetical protein LEP1GSC024_3424 [Leptospira noguchii str. 2001034031]|uniref:Uncharacterized protein n=2 Tax=Leptospira noguchii TaxID=28182 RepID=M6XZX3_9LEPT|nr:hypothetical protein LEP1GSC024_3424 [Leptospira noguchii str. 2001034031]
MKFASDSPQFSYVELTLIYTPAFFGVLNRVERKIKANFKN